MIFEGLGPLVFWSDFFRLTRKVKNRTRFFGVLEVSDTKTKIPASSGQHYLVFKKTPEKMNFISSFQEIYLKKPREQVRKGLRGKASKIVGFAEYAGSR